MNYTYQDAIEDLKQDNLYNHILIRSGAALQSIHIGDAKGAAKYASDACRLVSNFLPDLRNSWYDGKGLVKM